MTNDDKDLNLKKLNAINKLREFVSNLERLPSALNKIIDDNFWELLEATPQQSSEPLKELDEKELTRSIGQVYCKPAHAKKQVDSTLVLDIVDHICKTFGQPSEKNPIASIRESFKEEYRKTYPSQPSEKKALSREELMKLVDEETKDMFDNLTLIAGKMEEAQREYVKAKNALPAQREVRYPEKLDHDHSCEFDCKGCISNGWNQAINKMRKLNS